MEKVKLSAQDRKWQAQDDARMLMNAESIKSDPARLRAAAIEARRIATEAEKVAARQKTAAARIQPKLTAKPAAAKRGK